MTLRDIANSQDCGLKEIGPENVQQGVYMARQIVGHVSRGIHGKPLGERLRRRAEVCVNALAGRTQVAERFNDAFGLQTLAH